MSSNSSLDDLNNHVLIGDCSNNIKSLVVDTDHLYRHLTEVNGRDTRVRDQEICMSGAWGVKCLISGRLYRGPAGVPGVSSGLVLRPEDQPGVRRGRQEGVGDSGARGGRQEAPPKPALPHQVRRDEEAAGAGGQGPHVEN